MTTLAVSAPVSAATVQMSSAFGTEEQAEEASTINILSTLFSLATMPLMSALYQLICK